MTSTFDFFESDFHATLYPLKTNLILLQNHADEVSNYIYKKILNPSCEMDNFLSQHKSSQQNQGDIYVER